MRRREKFVLASTVLSLGLALVQYTGLEWRYYAIMAFMLVTYGASAWALRDDLQSHEWFTVLPFPVIYSAAVSFFYFLLPDSLVTQVVFLGLFGVGMYALYLTSNIFSVAKGRTIQLLYAAHAVGLFFTLFTSMLFTNTIFTFRFPFYVNAFLGAVVHFPLIMMSLWSIKLDSFVSKAVFQQTVLLTLILAEVMALVSLLPFPAWHSALFVMGLLYIGIGILQSQLRERLFQNTANEYSLVALFLAFTFFVLMPWK